MKQKKKNEVVVFQARNGAIELRGDVKKETIWASLDQISGIFGRDKSVISRHIKNIFKDEELKKNSVVAFFATTASDGKTYEIEYFNLDMILSVGYRVNSKQATQFRIWATKTLKQYISEGYVINPSRIAQNYEKFLLAVEETKKLLPANNQISAQDAMELIKLFAGTWFSLDAYDKQALPIKGMTKKKVVLAGAELSDAILQLKKELIVKKQAKEIFSVERQGGSLAGILGNVLQSFGGKDLYPTIEEKAVHLLYFVVKNHPFIDGNKRSGAFSFVWFLQKTGFNFREKITPEALTALTLLVAESDPKEKDRIIGLLLLLLQK